MNSENNCCSICISYRYFIVFLAAIGVGVVRGLNTSVGVIMIAMVNHTDLYLKTKLIDSTPIMDECKNVDLPVKPDPEQDGPYLWSLLDQGIIFSSFYWGYTIGPLLGSIFSRKINCKNLIVVMDSIFICSFGCMPFIIKYSYKFIIVVRVAQGIFEGITIVSLTRIIRYWTPPNEIEPTFGMFYSGSTLGTALFALLASVATFFYKWEYSFYIIAGFSLLWLLIFALFTAQKPNNFRYVTQRERSFIMKSLEYTPRPQSNLTVIPWCSIIKSVSVWSYLIAQTSYMWIITMLYFELPMFCKQILGFNQLNTGIFIFSLFSCMLVFGIGFFFFMRFLKNYYRYSKTAIRKISNFIAFFPTMICFLFITFYLCKLSVTVTLLFVSFLSLGASLSGHRINIHDISLNFSSFVYGLTNLLASTPGIVIPIFMGLIKNKEYDFEEWSILFYFSAFFCFLNIAIYTLCASGESEVWNFYIY